MATTRSVQAQGGPAGAPGEVPLLLSVPEAARLLGVGVTFGWMLVHNGDVPSVRLGRRVLVPRADLERLVDAARDSANGVPPVRSFDLSEQLAPGQTADPHRWHEPHMAGDTDD